MTEVEITDVCSEIASMMISCGAEIYRVEDTAERICSAYGFNDAEIYATPANFIISIKDSDGRAYTDSKALKGRETNLDRVGKLNELSRYICKHTPPHSEIMRKIENISERKTYKIGVIYASYMVVGASFAIYYGAMASEAFFAALLAALIKFLDDRLRRLRSSTFLSSVVCSMAVAFLAVIISKIGIVPRYDCIIIGAFMTMVPGVAMTNCMRDFISGDFFSGIYTLTEALLTAVGMAVGAGVAVAAAAAFS